MCNVPTIDMTGTGRNIVKLRQNAGLSVKDLQDILDLPLQMRYTSGRKVWLCQP